MKSPAVCHLHNLLKQQAISLAAATWLTKSVQILLIAFERVGYRQLIRKQELLAFMEDRRMTASVTQPNHVVEFPDEFNRAVEREAEKDADEVAVFLSNPQFSEQLKVRLGDVVMVPVDVLLGLGLVIRLRRWEFAGIQCHLDAGLPSADQVCQQVLAPVRSPELASFVADSWRRALQAFHESIVWSTEGCDLSAIFALQATEEDDDFIEGVADFLWQQIQRSN